MIKLQEVDDFLSIFQPGDITKIIQDAKLLDEGYQIFYIVDTYDIINYTLPFTSDSYIKEFSSGKLSFNAIAYESIFGMKSKTNLFLLDEYKFELLSIKNKIQSAISHFPKVRNAMLNILRQENDIKSHEAIENLIKKNLDVLIALLIFIEYGDNIFNRLIDLINNKLNIFNFRSENSNVEEVINSIFNEVRITDLTEELYDEFCDRSSMKLLSLEDSFSRGIYLENAYRDIAVIDRIIGLNKILASNYPESKILFVYLSSTPYKTDVLFELLGAKKNILPNIGNFQNFNFSRNIFQCFLLQSISQYKEQFNGFNVVEILTYLKGIVERTKFVESSSKGIPILLSDELLRKEDSVLTILREILLQFQKNIENTVIFDYYLKYRESLDESLKNLKSNKNRKELEELFTKTDSIINTSILVNSFTTPLMNLSSYKQTFFLSNRVYFNNDLFHKISIPFGKDIIRFSYHQLPGLLYIDGDSNLGEKVSIFLNLILNDPERIKELSNQFNEIINEIIQLLAKSTGKNLNDLTQDFLILSLINLVTPPATTFEASYSSNILENEKEIIDILRRQKAILRKTHIMPKIVINKNGGHSLTYDKNLDIPIVKEINYLLLWLLRRDNRFEEAIKLGNEVTETYPDDIRFRHGLALAYHSRAYSFLFCKKKQDKNIDEAISDLEKSYDYLTETILGYVEILSKEDKKIIISIIKKNLIAVFNTMADAQLRLFRLTGNTKIEYLNRTRECIIKMKELFTELNEKFDDHPTINHTETELNYCNAVYEHNNNEISKALRSILEATSRIYLFEKKSDQINPNFLSIITEIAKLRFILFTKVGYIK